MDWVLEYREILSNFIHDKQVSNISVDWLSKDFYAMLLKNPVKRPQTIIAGPLFPLADFQTYEAGPWTTSIEWMKILPNLPEFFPDKTHCITVF